MTDAESEPGVVQFAHAVSTSADAMIAIDEISEDLRAFRGCDLLQLFISAHHIEEAPRIAAVLRGRLAPGVLLAVTVEAVIAGGREFERTPGVAALAARLPGVEIHPFASPSLEHSTGEGAEGVRAIRELIGAGPHLRASIFYADPFSTPLNRLLPMLNNARTPDRRGRPTGAIIGGVASGASKAGQNSIIVNDRALQSGFAGVSLSGPIRVDAVVSQGCRPIGENLVITKAKNNVIYELGGRPALEVVRELLDTLGGHDRELLQQGLFVGRVVSEYKQHFGRGDYLIRNIAGVNPKTNIVAVHDLVRAGQTVRFHIRDAQTAAEDLELLLDAQVLHGPPAGVLLITCTGRGRNLFDHAGHDARAIQHAFEAPVSGEQQAKGGRVLDPSARTVPLAGLFAAGEIGPIGEASYLHGHSACAVMFRA